MICQGHQQQNKPSKKRWKKPSARKDDSVRAMLRIEPKPRRNAGRRPIPWPVCRAGAGGERPHHGLHGHRKGRYRGRRHRPHRREVYHGLYRRCLLRGRHKGRQLLRPRPHGVSCLRRHVLRRSDPGGERKVQRRNGDDRIPAVRQGIDRSGACKLVLHSVHRTVRH